MQGQRQPRAVRGDLTQTMVGGGHYSKHYQGVPGEELQILENLSRFFSCIKINCKFFYNLRTAMQQISNSKSSG